MSVPKAWVQGIRDLAGLEKFFVISIPPEQKNTSKAFELCYGLFIHNSITVYFSLGFILNL